MSLTSAVVLLLPRRAKRERDDDPDGHGRRRQLQRPGERFGLTELVKALEDGGCAVKKAHPLERGSASATKNKLQPGRNGSTSGWSYVVAGAVCGFRT